MPWTPPEKSRDEIMYCRSHPTEARSEMTYGEFVDRNQRWIRHHPEAFVMGDGTLHSAICSYVRDLTDLQFLIGAHKDPHPLIRRALVEWEGYLKCRKCRPEVRTQ